MTTNRLTLEEVQQAYKNTGVSPTRGTIIKRNINNISSCGMGVIAYQAIGEDITKTGKAMDFLCSRFNEDYIKGFTMGFDSYKVSYPYPETRSDNYKLGFQDGLDISKVVFNNKD